MNTVINAFHPDYIKTYEPNFTREFRTVEANRDERIATHGKVKTKKKKPKMNYKTPKRVINTRAQQNMTMSEVRRELDEKKRKILELKNFYTYAKAGMPKGVH
jgi:hypothetical protein